MGNGIAREDPSVAIRRGASMDRGNDMGRSGPTGVYTQASMYQGAREGANALGPSFRVWVTGHAWQLMQPLDLPIASRNTFSKEWPQSRVLGLAVDENGVAVGSRHDHNSVIRTHLRACGSFHNTVDLDEHWQFHLAGQCC